MKADWKSRISWFVEELYKVMNIKTMNVGSCGSFSCMNIEQECHMPYHLNWFGGVSGQVIMHEKSHGSCVYIDDH